MLNIKDKKGNIITDKDVIMEWWREYLQKIIRSRETQDIDEGEKTVKREEGRRKEKLKEVINRAELGKAPGKNNITPEIIKYIGKDGIDWLQDLMDDIIRIKKIPKRLENRHYSTNV